MKTAFFITSIHLFLFSGPNINNDTFNKNINQKAPVVSKQSIQINSNAEKVWSVLSDINNWQTWQKDISH